MPTRREAERAAMDVLRTTWMEDGFAEIPVDPVVIAERLGATVLEADLDPSVSGALVKRHDEDPVIYLSRGDHEQRRRFSCAHEIGHLVDRPDDDHYTLVDFRDALSSQGIDQRETFANQFAAALLMPEFAVDHFYTPDRTTAALAAEFGVSTESMSWRLHNLGKRLRGG